MAQHVAAESAQRRSLSAGHANTHRSRRTSFVFLVFALQVLVSTPLVAATTVHVYVSNSTGADSTSDPRNPACRCVAMTCQSMACAVQEMLAETATSSVTASVIVLPGIYTGPNNCNITIASKGMPLVVDILGQSPSGNAGDITFLLQDQQRFFNVFVFEGSAITRDSTLQHMTFDGAWEIAVLIQGGAAPILNDLGFTNCKISPALYISDPGTFPQVLNSQFTHNGDVVSDSVITVADGAQAEFDTLTLRYNNAQRGIYLRTGFQLEYGLQNVTIVNTDISMNGRMAAEFMGEYRQLVVTMRHCTMNGNGNEAASDTIRVSSTHTPAIVIMDDVYVTENTVNFAAINVVPDVSVNLFIYNSVISNNDGGSGFFKTGGGTLHVESTTFSKNTNIGLQREGFNDGGGGVQLAGSAYLQDVTFNLNSAKKGGGLYLGPYAFDVTLNNVRITNNLALTEGSAIYADCSGGPSPGVASGCSAAFSLTSFDGNDVEGAALKTDRTLISVRSGARLTFLNSTISCDNDPTYSACDDTSLLIVDGKDSCNITNEDCPDEALVAVAVVGAILLTATLFAMCFVYRRKKLRQAKKARKALKEEARARSAIGMDPVEMDGDEDDNGDELSDIRDGYTLVHPLINDHSGKERALRNLHLINDTGYSEL